MKADPIRYLGLGWIWEDDTWGILYCIIVMYMQSKKCSNRIEFDYIYRDVAKSIYDEKLKLPRAEQRKKLLLQGCA